MERFTGSRTSGLDGYFQIDGTRISNTELAGHAALWSGNGRERESKYGNVADPLRASLVGRVASGFRVRSIA